MSTHRWRAHPLHVEVSELEESPTSVRSAPPSATAITLCSLLSSCILLLQVHLGFLSVLMSPLFCDIEGFDYWWERALALFMIIHSIAWTGFSQLPAPRRHRIWSGMLFTVLLLHVPVPSIRYSQNAQFFCPHKSSSKTGQFSVT